MVQTTVRAYVYMAPRWALGSQNATWSDAEQRITQAGMRPRDAVRVIESARAAFPRLELLEAVAQLLADHPALQVTESFVVRQAKKARPEEAKVWRREEARQLEEQKREEARVFEESGGAAGLRARLGECPIAPPTAAEVARQRAEAQRLAQGHDEEAMARRAQHEEAMARRAQHEEELTAEEVVRQAEAEGLTLLRSASSSTGFKCVSFNGLSKNKPYLAMVTHGGKKVNLGRFATPEEAALVVAQSMGQAHTTM